MIWYLQEGEIVENNIFNTALILEGGGMRGSFTAGILNTLVKNEVFFNYVVGVSSGSSNAVNYMTRDIKRTKDSFVNIVNYDEFGGIKSFLKGQGLFNSEYIYNEAAKPNGPLQFNFEDFKNNPGRINISAYNLEKDQIDYFTNEDILNKDDLLNIVKASSSLPIIMPKTEYNGFTYYDGGLEGGIPLQKAKNDGFESFFVILTRPRGYRREPFQRFKNLIKLKYKNYPGLYKALFSRHIYYNKTLLELEKLEAEGKAILVYPDQMLAERATTDHDILLANYNLATEQANKNMDSWKSFLKKHGDNI